ncbi:DUF4333 domain-containing protein [Aquihabitans daechungensis]|uniref:DUF4333 domain-containing protein n=1 Tax=Aquihabitans daechungensis TaxID=1052257 RepID=UPI003B9F379D
MTVRAPIAGLLLATAVTGIVALGACSEEAGTLDPAATERAVGRAVAAEVEPDVSATRCTGELVRVAGGTFTCTVTLEGAGPLEVDVRQVDDEGTLDVTPTAAVVATDRIVSELTESLEAQFKRTFTVRCSGDPIQIRTPSSTSTCSARDKTSAREVTVTVTDRAGTLSFSVAPPK